MHLPLAQAQSLTRLWKSPPQVPAPQSKQHTPVSLGPVKNWDLSLSIQRISKGATWLDTFLHGIENLFLSGCLGSREKPHCLLQLISTVQGHQSLRVQSSICVSYLCFWHSTVLGSPSMCVPRAAVCVSPSLHMVLLLSGTLWTPVLI